MQWHTSRRGPALCANSPNSDDTMDSGLVPEYRIPLKPPVVMDGPWLASSQITA